MLDVIGRVFSVCLLAEYGEESDDKRVKLLKRSDLWLVSIMPLVTKQALLVTSDHANCHKAYCNCSKILTYSCW